MASALKAYLSLIVTLVPNFIATVVAVAAAGHITQPVEIGLVIAILQPLIVVISPNLPDAKYVKAALSVIIFVAQALLQILPAGGIGSLSSSQKWFIAGSFVAAVLVYFFPNQPRPAPVPVPAR